MVTYQYEVGEVVVVACGLDVSYYSVYYFNWLLLIITNDDMAGISYEN